jgi:hypothetical protein
MRSQRGRLAAFLSMGLLCLVLLTGVLCYYVSVPIYQSLCFELGCLGGIAPARAFPIRDLLLDESDLPLDWQVRGEPHHPEYRLPAEQIALTFGIDHCGPYSLGASHSVCRFVDGIASASYGYRYKTSIWFAPGAGLGPWHAPAELAYESPVADQYRFQCGVYSGSTRRTCQAVGQYEEYLVRFHTTIDPDHPRCMSFSDLESILVTIDERMAFYLGKDPQ